MRQIRPRMVTLIGLAVLVLAPVGVMAQGASTYTIGLMAGLGGSTEDDPDTDLDNFGWQALFDMKIDSVTSWGVRAGQLSLETDDSAFDIDLNYLTVAGQYRFSDDIVDSGLYLGLGVYDFDGEPAFGSDTALGLALGVTGRVGITEKLSVLLELSGHYADLDQAQFFVMGHVGLGYHF